MTNNNGDMKTFSRKPFISYDGVDEKGVRAEVKVITGFGHVAEIETSKKGNSHNIKFKVDNSQYLPSGWVPDQAILSKVKKAHDNNEPIHFRLENHRKEGVDRSLPMSEVVPPGDMNAAKANIFKSLAAVRFDDESEWTISSMARTNMKEDPAPGGIYSANAMSNDELNNKKTSSNQSTSSKNSPESMPWSVRNSDGEVNPGASAVGILITNYGYVTEWEREHNISFSEKERIAIAKAMLSIANQLQIDVYSNRTTPLEKPDLSLGSHVRARAIIFEVIKSSYPLSSDVVSDGKHFKTWVENVKEKAYKMWKWSMSEIDKLS